MDELGDGGSVASFVESSTVTVTVTVPSGSAETMTENMEGDLKESYDGEDGGDLMIEVVGSDVFVDGVNGNAEVKEDLGRDMGSFGIEHMIEGNIGSGEAADFECPFWDGRTEAVDEGFHDIPSELDKMSGLVVKKEENEEQGVEASVGEHGELVEEPVLEGAKVLDDKASGKVSQGTVVLDHEVCNPGIDDVGKSSLTAGEQDDSAEKDVSSLKDEIQGRDVVRDDDVPSGKDQTPEIEKVETVSEGSDKENVCQASVSYSGNPAEAVIRRHVQLVAGEESIHENTQSLETKVNDHNFLSSGEVEPMKDDQVVDNSSSHDNLCDDVLTSSELPNSVRKTEIIDKVDIPTGKIEDSGVESEAASSNSENEARCSEVFPTTNHGTMCGSDGDIHAASESSLEQASAVERGEWVAMVIDEVLDFKVEAIVLDAHCSVLSSTEKVENTFGKSMIVPDYGVTVKDTGAEPKTVVNDIKTTVDFKEGEGPIQSGLVIVEEHADMVRENVEVDVRKGVNTIEVPEADAPEEKDEQFNTLDVTRVAEKNFTVEGNSISSSELNGALVPVGLSSESQVADPECYTIHQGPPSEINDNKVDEGALIKGEEGSFGNYLAEVPVGVPNASFPEAEPNVVTQVDVQEMKIEGGEKGITVGEQYPGDTENEKESDCLQSNNNDLMQVDILETKSKGDGKGIAVDEQYSDDSLVDHGEEDKLLGENASEGDQSNVIEEKTTKTLSSVSIGQPGYLLGPANDGEFYMNDLVWGKVRSHPWWPGQIFDPADASDKALKYQKKDCFLVAYFGDRTFAWNDASLLKPFRPHFPQIEKQSNSEAFQNAVSCALHEVSRRVKLGLSCSSVARDAIERIECQIVENTGIREKSSRRYGVDKSSGATSFEPDKLLQYVRLLAESPFCLVDRLEFVIAQAQLSAFCCYKGYREPPEFESRDAMLEKGVKTLELSDTLDQSVPASNDDEQLSSPHKHKENLKDSLHPRKERSLSELIGDMEYPLDEEEDSDGKVLSKSVATPLGKKRKAADPLTDGSDRRISFYAAKVSPTSSVTKPSFKVGDCIRRVASQLTGSVPVLKGINEQAGIDISQPTGEDSQQGIMAVPTEISSLQEMLSQLRLAACDPTKGYSFLNNVMIFYSGFRNSVVRKHVSVGRSGGGRKRKADHMAVGATEEFEFDDVNDSYWTDRSVQNYSEEQLPQITENGERDYQPVASDSNKSRKSGRGSHSRKRYSNGNYEGLVDEQPADVDRKNLESSPAELVLTFAEGGSLPSVINLNKMFRRFGPLKESETEVALDSRRARVIFKRGADAEAAHSSAGRINIFGSMVVSYQLNYLPSTNFSSLPLLMLQGSEEAT